MSTSIAFSSKHKKILLNKYETIGSGIRIIDFSRGIKIDDLTMRHVRSGIWSVNEEFFITKQNLDEDYYNFSFELRSFRDPASKICRWKVVDSEVEFEGDSKYRDFDHLIFWSRHPSGAESNGKLSYLDTRNSHVKELALDWYNGDNFDLGYQGIVEILKVPNQFKAIIFVARSNTAVEIDLENGNCQNITIGPTYGQVKGFVFLKNQILAIAYDTLYLLESETYKILKELEVQPRTSQVFSGVSMPIRQFMGDLSVVESEGVIYACRPFSNDIAAISLESFEVTKLYQSSFQPLYVFRFQDKLIAIDWLSLNAEIISLSVE